MDKAFVAGSFGIITGTIADAGPILIVMFILVLLDLLTGLWAAAATHTKIESRIMRKTVTKLLAYVSLIICCALVDDIITDMFHLVAAVGGFISVIEIISLIENFGRITGNDIMDKLKEFLTNKIFKKGQNKRHNNDDITKQ